MFVSQKNQKRLSTVCFESVRVKKQVTVVSRHFGTKKTQAIVDCLFWNLAKKQVNVASRLFETKENTNDCTTHVYEQITTMLLHNHVMRNDKYVFVNIRILRKIIA